MNNFFYLLNLKKYQAIFNKIFYSSFEYLILFFGLGLFFSGNKFFLILGFWLFVIYFLDLLIFKKRPNKNLLFEKENSLVNYLDENLKFTILNSVFETRDLSLLDSLLFYKLLEFKEVRKIFFLLNIDELIIKREVNYIFNDFNNYKKIDLTSENKIIFWKNIEPLLINSYKISRYFNNDKITPSSLLVSVIERNNPLICSLLNKFNIDLLDIYSSFILANKISFNNLFINLDWLDYDIFSYQKYNYLNKFCKNLNLLVKLKHIGWLVNREKELQELLEQKNPKRIILVGLKNTGKKSIIYNLAYLIVNNKTPDNYLNNKIFELNFNDKNIFDNLNSILIEANLYSDVIIFIPDVCNINFDLLWLQIEQFLNKTKINLILSTTLNDFKINNSKYNLEKKFKVMFINDLTEKEVLVNLIHFYQNKNILIHPKAFSKVVSLAKNYFNNNFSLLDNSKNLLDKCLDFCYQNNLKFLTEEIVGDVFGMKTTF
ncbi:MAG: hypothetical protein KatS3mg095_0029 [Candidatus Parcubacteria bacterium]|nr:MAG: hypothetical protein KatS3mg095_0029 [Candidatus Parcubacteria bacterium]